MSGTPAGQEGRRDRLRAWFDTRWSETFGTPPGSLALTVFEPLTKGQSSDLIEVRCVAGNRCEDYVVRCEPRAKQIFFKPDVLREAEVLKGVEKHGTVPVPHVWWTESDETVLGAPFFAMSKVNGVAPLGRPSIHLAGLLAERSAQSRRRMWESAIQALVAVHALDWRKTHGFLLPEDRSRGLLTTHIESLQVWYGWVAGERTFPVTDAALDYLLKNAAACEPDTPVLVWNDARVGNMLFDSDDCVAAVVDWEQPLIGPPEIDLGYWLMMDEFHAEGIGVKRLSGWPSEAETIRRYEALSGRTIRNITYFIVRAAFFMATTVIRQADFLVKKGSMPAQTRMGHDNTLTRIIARCLDLPVPEMSLDWAEYRKIPRDLMTGGS